MRLKCRTSDSRQEVKSTLHPVDYGTPQGSCLGTILFLIFTNNLYHYLLYTNCILFTDDTTLYVSSKNLDVATCSMIEDLTILQDWFNANKLTLNLNKTVSMLLTRKKVHIILNHELVQMISLG